MKSLKQTLFACLLLFSIALFLGAPTTAEAVPANTTVVADSWSYWIWDCYGSDYHSDYDWFWGPSWYWGAGWYSGFDWTWTPYDYWNDYLYSYYCYYVWVEIYGTSVVQVPNTNSNCSYTITVNFSDNSTQSFTQQGTGGDINLYFTHSATDPVPTGSTATETCAGAVVVDLVILKGGINVTNQITQLVIGEPAQFTVQPGPNAQNMTISSVQWSQPSNAYKSYTFNVNTGAAIPLVLNTATFDGFFASPRQDEEITAAVTVNQQQYMVKTKVTVLAPSTTMSAQTHPTVSFSMPANIGRFTWGQGTTPGIQCSYTGNDAAGGGTYMVVQVFSESSGSTCASGYSGGGEFTVVGKLDVTSTAVSPVYDDVSFSVQQGSGSSQDSPGFTVRPQYYKLSQNLSATTYLMFKSDRPNSYPVAVMKTSWDSLIAASGYGWTNWNLDGPNSSHSTNPPSQSVYELPMWSGAGGHGSFPQCK